MNFTLIICTYKRSIPLMNLLESVKLQTLYPSEIIVVDGSPDDETKIALQKKVIQNLIYYKVNPEDRGLTRQRNFGILKVSPASEIVCFLDDDTVLTNNYFYEIIETFKKNPAISGVGGVAINEDKWFKPDPLKKYSKNKFYSFNGFLYPESKRNIVRNYFRLNSNLGPGQMPLYSHGRTCGFPLDGKTYEVDLLIGMSFSFRKIVVDNLQFSNYFEGYGLYEDADYSIRAQMFGKNVINTNAQLSHYHDASGRPSRFLYGKMVVRNGWYVWRVKNPSPDLKSKFKWHAITLLLTTIRYTNILNTSSFKRHEAFTEALGRTVGWWSLIFSKPKPESE